MRSDLPTAGQGKLLIKTVKISVIGQMGKLPQLSAGKNVWSSSGFF